MATAAVSPAYAGTSESSHSGLWSWLTTVDHKRIGVLYMFTSLAWFAVGGLEALIMRWQLKGPNGHVVAAGRNVEEVVLGETYYDGYYDYTYMHRFTVMPAVSYQFNKDTKLEIKGKPQPFKTGDLAFVPKNVPHRFVDISDDFATWVAFFG